MLIGVMDGLTLQWLSFDSSAEDMLTEPYVKMLQSALATIKYERGMAR